MKLASHNSWSYLKPRKWWMKLIGFTARCQSIDIKEQYEKEHVRCFDLRLRFNNGKLTVVHGIIEYNITYQGLLSDLRWLNSKKDAAVRILLDVRSKKSYTEQQVYCFRNHCSYFESTFPCISFWCGRNLYDWKVEYNFEYYPSCEEKYSSVCKPKYIDDWWPWFFAWRKNESIVDEGTKKDYLMIDFVQIR